jgi:hypothetical protein
MSGMTTRPSRADDHDLTLAALQRIVTAKKRGVLSRNLSIRMLPTQIVLEHTSEQDQTWLFEQFPGEIRPRGWLERRGRNAVEAMMYIAPLREKVEESYVEDHPPRVEVWDLSGPHVCNRFTAHADTMARQKIRWTCSAHNCRKPITLTKARELGLLPPREKK